MARNSDQDLEQRLRELGPIARELEDLDHVRRDPPSGLWSAIEAEIVAADVPIARRRGLRQRGLLAVAAAAVVVALVGVGIAVRDDGPGQVPLAEAALRNDDLDARGSATSGSATVVRRDSHLVLNLRLQQAPPLEKAYLEVWMIDRQVEGMVSLGPYSGDGEYSIPDSIDPSQYPIIDVSIEPTDGVPTHSKVSIIRGILA